MGFTLEALWGSTDGLLGVYSGGPVWGLLWAYSGAYSRAYSESYSGAYSGGYSAAYFGHTLGTALGPIRGLYWGSTLLSLRILDLDSHIPVLQRSYRGPLNMRCLGNI